MSQIVFVFSGCSSARKNDSPPMSSSSETYSNSAYAQSDTMQDGYDNFNTEEYGVINENSFQSTALRPLSTFSADVDTASYSNVRRMINQNTRPPEDSVRIEEMINYFHYDYPQPVGNEPFSVTTEISNCPWNKDTMLLLVGMQAKNIDINEIPPSNLVFLIDVSGSMEDSNKLPLLKRSFMLLTEQLGPQDRVSIVTYASADLVLLEGADGNDKNVIMNAIEDLTAGGSTAGSKGITTAYSIAEKYFIEGGNNRIILATDGDFNVGTSSEGELKKLIEEKRKKGVYLSVLGFGMGNIKDNKMETLADNGNGNYAYIDDISEARKVLVEELGATLFTVAKDVKFQVEFNPAKIRGYRLVGYENRLLKDKDFEDDTKDAGELGAGHRVTVLYELVPVDSEYEIQKTELKYQKQNAEITDTNELLTVNVRYKEPNADESKLLTYPVADSAFSTELSDNMLFSSSVAQVGMLLRNSEFSGTASINGVLEQLSQIKNLENDTYKTEFKELTKKLVPILK